MVNVFTAIAGVTIAAKAASKMRKRFMLFSPKSYTSHQNCREGMWFSQDK